MKKIAARFHIRPRCVSPHVTSGESSATQHNILDGGVGRPRTLHRHHAAVAKLSRRGLSGRKIAAKLNIPAGSVFAVLKSVKSKANGR